MLRRFGACLILLLFFTAGCTFRSRVIVVNIVNATSSDVRNIELRYPGGSFGVSSLAPGKTYQYRIKPFFTGSVIVEFLPPAGKLQHTEGPRVQKDQEGQLSISISDKGVEWGGLN